LPEGDLAITRLLVAVGHGWRLDVKDAEADRDGRGLLGFREYRTMAELLEEIDQPPPGPRCFDRM
jgi:hypothetical protein